LVVGKSRNQRMRPAHERPGRRNLTREFTLAVTFDRDVVGALKATDRRRELVCDAQTVNMGNVGA
jgi:hypothetical protein